MVLNENDSDGVDLVRKAVNLFTFLGSTQRLLIKPVYTVDKFEHVMWFADLPDHAAVRSAHRTANPEPDSPLLEVDRALRLDPPILPAELEPWVEGPIEDAHHEPMIREAIYVGESESDNFDGVESDDDDESAETEPRTIELVDVPEVAAAFDAWTTDWRLWAERERRDSVVRNIYKDLFGVHLTSTDHSEEFELVLGIGCLTWRPEDHEQVQRHVATAPITINFDENSGMLTVVAVPSPENVSIELDMLDPALIPSPSKIDEIRQLAAEYEGHLLDRPAIGDVCRRLTHRLDASAEYDEDALSPHTGSAPRGAFAPALILRRRTKRGLVQIYEQIVSQIQATGDVPAGVLPLIDPDRQPSQSDGAAASGAVITIDEEDFLPLPVNEAQRKIIERVDRNAQTVVQGPPGTGKTHTAAALVSHLLAQGKRVLITAQTDRALHEVRDKLPREIRSLAVSVIGQSRTDMADLRTAVDSISQRADEFDPDESRRAIEGHLARIDDLRRRRAETYDRLIAIRLQEVEIRSDGPEEDTLAAIAYRHLEQEPQLSWIREFDVDPNNVGTSVSSEEIVWWREVLMNLDVAENEGEATRRLPAVESLVPPQEFSTLVVAERQAIAHKTRFDNLLSHESFDFVRSLAPDVREELRSRVSALAERAGALERREEAWMNEALRDVRSGRHQIWMARSAQIKSLAEQVEVLIGRIGPTTSVATGSGDVGVQQQIAKSLLAHLDSGGKIKTLPNGSPKIGALSPKTVKLAEPFFTEVKINGLPAVTKEQLAAFVDWVDASRTITAMDQAWPASVQIPDEDTLAEELHWHRTEVAQLDKVLELGQQLEVERAWFQANDLPVPDWNKLDEIRRYAELVEAATAADGAVSASAPVEALVGYLESEARWPDPPQVVSSLLDAVRNRDTDAYAAAHRRLVHLHRVAEMVAERNRVHARLEASAPRLAAAIMTKPDASEWADRLPSYSDAWRWEMTGRWIMAQDVEDANALKVQLNGIEQQIRSEVEHLAAERAWGHAVAPGRLTGRARANLAQYAQLVASLGKGTGKYAAKKRVEITEAMDRCRSSVPVWIMPIYRIAEQLRVQPNSFDVVIVDEASQAGLEATFLQYLAPKIVVIGDDKQVSPSAVGVDQQQLRDLANLYLANDTYRASWLDPKRSYFDEANMRFGGRITLTEHRRCVPEIIGFSNRIAYEPEGIRLVPVRQFGAARLDPIKVVYLADGYEADNKTNPVEAEAIVDQIVKCLAEPEYDGATFGVISLLGKEQARLIESKLLDAVPPEEWAARDLRCGDAPDFQGSERDVMFLSMVKSPREDKRMGALTMGQYVQRFNVAASRAKNQMWVYHSMPRDALTNPEDMRYQLLDYCYGVVNRTQSDGDANDFGPVPEDVLVPPFDSLFEQRVFNRIIDRGYTVLPQHEAMGYKIDLVILGARGRLAVECDGDFWHGPEAYEADLARQRELERCDWKFFRIRESMFYADMPGTLAKLWERLDELDIRPADWVDPIAEEVAIQQEVVTEEAADAESAAGESDGSTTDSERLEVLAAQIEPVSHIDETVESKVPVATSLVAVGRHHAEGDDEMVQTVDEVHSSVLLGDGEGRHRAYDDDADVIGIAAGASSLEPYVVFRDPLPPITESRLNEVVANVIRIVEIEGPVLGHRVHQAYREAYGGQRVGREIARQLNQALLLAERRSLIVSSNPLNEPGVKPRTFRIASQPEVLPRRLGPRSLDMVPPAEVAHHLRQFLTEDAPLAEECLFRAVLDVLGLKRLTDNARTVLRKALRLAGSEQ
ncbi:ATP-binding protein IstB [Mycobacterium lehmannii]|uniref:ATP-binding protein IstB n=1 Tax=Mycobacterium lehmannii TaxID=2048550 RepID=A0A101A8H7_9MYCO|nr:AAA domain-containing protein [Mycobacterium lehmannii]KUI17020.1 ATP-binding protein IstB [Mycobacterium lehmannii]